jgi:predicted nucleic acid-binding protein
MIAVSDTSPLNYLVQIGCESLLPKIYKRILVPTGVIHELSRPSAPQIVRDWAARPPDWLEIDAECGPPDSRLASLGLGEREAIQLATLLHADVVLIDERRGTRFAQRIGLSTTGTLGVLARAGQLGLIDPVSVFKRLLSETSFRASPEISAQFLGRQ